MAQGAAFAGLTRTPTLQDCRTGPKVLTPR